MKTFQEIKANITTRNFPEPLKTFEKWKNERQETRIVFTTDENNKIVLICNKIQ
jgi:hypothetical protein